MFTGFTMETSRFLWDLSFNNERPWFLEHKEQFERCLNQPFKALAAETLEQMRRRFPQLELEDHVSRIYRDARRLFGRGPYKDHLWFTVYTAASGKHGPGFWFEIGPAQYSYGLGFFETTPAAMAVFRRMVDANPARFERLARQTERLPGFRVIGPEYKRPKGDYGEPISHWYNRRYLAIESAHDFGGDVLDRRLPEILTEAFGKLMPLHDFLLEVWFAAREETDHV